MSLPAGSVVVTSAGGGAYVTPDGRKLVERGQMTVLEKRFQKEVEKHTQLLKTFHAASTVKVNELKAQLDAASKALEAKARALHCAESLLDDYVDGTGRTRVLSIAFRAWAVRAARHRDPDYVTTDSEGAGGEPSAGRSKKSARRGAKEEEVTSRARLMSAFDQPLARVNGVRSSLVDVDPELKAKAGGAPLAQSLLPRFVQSRELAKERAWDTVSGAPIPDEQHAPRFPAPPVMTVSGVGLPGLSSSVHFSSGLPPMGPAASIEVSEGLVNYGQSLAGGDRASVNGPAAGSTMSATHVARDSRDGVVLTVPAGGSASNGTGDGGSDREGDPADPLYSFIVASGAS